MTEKQQHELSREAMKRFDEIFPNGWSGSQEQFVWTIEDIKYNIIMSNPKKYPIENFFNRLSSCFFKIIDKFA